MARITTVDLAEARSRLKSEAHGYAERAAYREAIGSLTDDRMLELEPDAGETMRSLKLTVTRAAKEVNRDVRYGESDEGTLLVWLEDRPRTTRRRRRRKDAGAGEE
jgi:hypothetical protein